MKKTCAFVALALLSVVLVSVSMPKAFADDWRDDFSYQTLGQLKDAGWTLENEQLTFVGGGLVDLTATDQKPSMIGYVFSGYSSPSGNSEFRVEIRQHVHDGPSGRNCTISILTERHRFSIACSVESSVMYDFLVDNQSSTPTIEDGPFGWHTLVFEKKGNTLNWYVDGTAEGSYTEPEDTRDGLLSVELQSNSSYDYVSVSGIPAPPLQSLYIVTIVVLAVGISIATFGFWRGTRARQKTQKQLTTAKAEHSNLTSETTQK
jgi:hypothetical protein